MKREQALEKLMQAKELIVEVGLAVQNKKTMTHCNHRDRDRLLQSLAHLNAELQQRTMPHFK